MIEIKQISKKNVPLLFEDKSFWNHDFLSISKHRLLSHYRNPNSQEDDIVLILAYLNNEIVGYMGVFIDKIKLDGIETKIGWLTTWWVHPKKTYRLGVGRQILDTAYQINDGKVGISQFTKSAKRVYDKTGYFNTLKENLGVKAVLRSNLIFVIPKLYPKINFLNPVLNFADDFLNLFINVKVAVQEKLLFKKLKNIELEYLNKPDAEALELINKYSKNDISNKKEDYFEWLKAYHWVQEAPLLQYTNKNKYEFSIYDEQFNIYYIKIIKDAECIGFLVLQRRNYVCKILFAYYDQTQHSDIVATIIKLQCIKQNVREIICYDEAICDNFKQSNLFIYKTKKIKQSIISKAFEKTDFNDVKMNFGDGDCCFA